MLDQEQIENWNDGYGVDMKKEILDLYSMYLHSAEYIPYKELIMKLQYETGSKSRLYDIACFIKDATEGNA